MWPCVVNLDWDNFSFFGNLHVHFWQLLEITVLAFEKSRPSFWNLKLMGLFETSEILNLKKSKFEVSTFET